MTAFRAHPVDLAVMAWVPALTTGIVIWCFHRYANAGIGMITFLGLHTIIWAFNLVGNLRHWQVWLSYGPTLNRWLISPAHHQLHHSYEPRHLGCNRGFELAVWDRLYGTLYVPPLAPETFRMGLGDGSDGQWPGCGSSTLGHSRCCGDAPRLKAKRRGKAVLARQKPEPADGEGTSPHRPAGHQTLKFPREST